jgi:hypothetical protein
MKLNATTVLWLELRGWYVLGQALNGLWVDTGELRTTSYWILTISLILQLFRKQLLEGQREPTPTSALRRMDDVLTENSILMCSYLPCVVKLVSNIIGP